MTDYESMSDFEINCQVAKASGFEDMMFFNVDKSICEGPVWAISSGWSDFGIEISKGNSYDPCNSWADAGPIIEKHKVSIIKLATKWMAIQEGSGIESYIGDEDNPCLYGDGVDVKHENPLRAAMIVFLMMKDKDGE